MTAETIGQMCALGAAMMWAFALVLFKRSGETVPALALNLYKNTVSLILLTVTLVVTGDGLSALRAHAAADIWILLASGVLGIAVADTLLFRSLNMIGVGLLAIVECLYSPMILAFTWLLLGATLSVPSIVGGLLVLGAVLVSSRLESPTVPPRQLAAGLGVGAAAILFMTFGIVWAKPVLDDFPLIWATTLRLLSGTLSLMLYAAAFEKPRADLATLRPSRAWRTMLPGSIIGGFVCYILWIAGFKYAHAAIAAILNQTSTVFALVLATLILHEPFSRRKGVAVTLAMAGVALVLAGSAPAESEPARAVDRRPAVEGRAAIG